MRSAAVLAVILVGLWATPALAQVPSGQLPPDANGVVDLKSPELLARIEAIRVEIKAKGWTFEAGINPATRYDLNQLCGRRIELLSPEAFENRYTAEGVTATAKPPSKKPTPPPPGPTRTPTPSPTATRTPVTPPSFFIGIFTPPKDRGNCDRCRAFGTIDEAETAVPAGTGALNGYVDGSGVVHSSTGATIPDVSEQYLLSCNPWRYGCGGGNGALAFLVAQRNGAMNESCFPYTAKNAACRYRPGPVRTSLSGWGYLSRDSSMSRPAPPSVALYAHTPRRGGTVPWRRG